jgi:hypothetical protein
LHFLILKDWNKKKHWKNNNTITRVSYEERKTHNKIVPTLKPYTPHKDLPFICFCENPLTPFVILHCLDLQFSRFHSFSLFLSWVNYQFSCWRKKKLPFFFTIMSTLLGILAEKISILRSFCRIFCWGGWRFEKFFNWCSFGLFQFEGDLVGFFGIENFSLWIGGVFFFTVLINF